MNRRGFLAALLAPLGLKRFAQRPAREELERAYQHAWVGVDLAEPGSDRTVYWHGLPPYVLLNLKPAPWEDPVATS